MDTTICVEWDDLVEGTGEEVRRKLMLTIPDNLGVFEFGAELKKVLYALGYHHESIERCFREGV